MPLLYEEEEFRPAYKNLANLRYEFPRTPIMILTATATPETTKKLLTLLHDLVIVVLTDLTSILEWKKFHLELSFQAVADKVSEVYNNVPTIVYTESSVHCKI